MRALHVTHRYYPFVGGSEIYCQEISERLVRDGNHVAVYATNAWDLGYFWDPRARHVDPGNEVHNGVDVRRFPVRHPLPGKAVSGLFRSATKRLARTPLGTRSLLSFLGSWSPWVPALWRQFSKETGAYDIVHATNISYESFVAPALNFARRRRIPFVITPFVHLGEPGDEATRQSYTMPHQVAMMRDSDVIVVQTDLERDYLVSMGLQGENMRKVGVGIDPNALVGGRGSRFREKHKLDCPIVFSIGAQDYDKGTVHLVEAMARLWREGCQAELVLAGPVTSAFDRYFRSLPEDVGRRTHMLGFVTEEEKKDLLDAGDVFAMPSRTDSFGIVYLEAWLYRKPVVGALAGGVPEVIEHGRDGYLVPFGDVPRTAEAINALLTDRTKARQFGERGYQKASVRHTWDRKYAAIKAIYEELAQRSWSG